MFKIFKVDKFPHFLFDYDGLLVDSEKLYFESWCLVLTDEGQKVCQQYHEGKHESEVYEKVKSYLKKPMSLREVSNYRKVTFYKLIAQGRLELVDGVKGLLDKLKNVAPMSIVSNSTKDIVEEGIKSTGLEGYFDNLFCFSDKVNRKPAPDLYNLAIFTLNLGKDSILALEDSISGILAAQEAGVPVVCINSNPVMEDFCCKNNVKYIKSASELLLSF